MGETKKVGSTGRFGSRYGVGIRKKLLKVESLQIQKQKCPNCGFPTVKRKSKGIFACKKCSHEFVGGAYTPKTITGGLISQMVSQKRFVPEAIEKLSEAKGEEAPIEAQAQEEKAKEATKGSAAGATKESSAAGTRKGAGEKKEEPKVKKEKKSEKKTEKKKDTKKGEK